MEKNVKVLLVDDEVDFTESLAFWLKIKGYSVLTASNGQEAVQVVKEKSPDIVFLDIDMPVMDGVEALKRIREFNKDLPVIIVSAYIDDNRINQTRPYGTSGIFYKGEEFQEALTLIEVALRTHKKLKDKETTQS